jgi:CheY-like chemotaxis protein
MRILLVEDHADSADMLTRLLRARGHDVEHAIDAGSATAAAESSRFDLVLCDLTLPDGNGRDLMRALHASRGLRGIALSGHAETVGLDGGGGFIAHLTKPVEFPALLALLDKVSA